MTCPGRELIRRGRSSLSQFICRSYPLGCGLFGLGEHKRLGGLIVCRRTIAITDLFDVAGEVTRAGTEVFNANQLQQTNIRLSNVFGRPVLSYLAKQILLNMTIRGSVCSRILAPPWTVMTGQRDEFREDRCRAAWSRWLTAWRSLPLERIQGDRAAYQVPSRVLWVLSQRRRTFPKEVQTPVKDHGFNWLFSQSRFVLCAVGIGAGWKWRVNVAKAANDTNGVVVIDN